MSLAPAQEKEFNGALQLLTNRYGQIRVAHVHERVSTKSLVVLIIGNSESNHLGAQSTFTRCPLLDQIERTSKKGY